MYRARIRVWIVTMIISIIIVGGIVPLLGNLINILRSGGRSFSIYMDVNSSTLKNNVSDSDWVFYSFDFGKMICDFTTCYDSSDADVIVRDYSETSAIEGYEKYSRYLYTPVVIYAPYVNKEDGGFHIINDNAYKKFDVILNAVEKQKTYGEIGMKHMNKDDKVKLVIPYENTVEYQAVEDLIYMTLNGGAMPDDSQRAALKQAADNILNQSRKSENIIGEIKSKYYKDKKDANRVLYLTTESASFMCDESEVFTVCGEGYKSAYSPVYTEPCAAVFYDVFVKKPDNDTDKSKDNPEDKISNVSPDIILDILYDSDYFLQVGIRTQNHKFKNTYTPNEVKATNYIVPSDSSDSVSGSVPASGSAGSEVTSSSISGSMNE